MEISLFFAREFDSLLILFIYVIVEDIMGDDYEWKERYMYTLSHWRNTLDHYITSELFDLILKILKLSFYKRVLNIQTTSTVGNLISINW